MGCVGGPQHSDIIISAHVFLTLRHPFFRAPVVAALVGNTPSLWHAHILPLGAMGVTISHLQLIFNIMKPLFSGGGGGGSEATVTAVEGSMAAASVDVARAGQR